MGCPVPCRGFSLRQGGLFSLQIEKPRQGLSSQYRWNRTTSAAPPSVLRFQIHKSTPPYPASNPPHTQTTQSSSRFNGTECVTAPPVNVASSLFKHLRSTQPQPKRYRHTKTTAPGIPAKSALATPEPTSNPFDCETHAKLLPATKSA